MKIYVYSQAITEKIAKELNKRNDISYAIISITAPGYRKANIKKGGAIKKIFRMSFYDVEKDMTKKIICARKKDIDGLKEFVDGLDDIDILIVHCYAGISRSAAVAAAIQLYLDMEDTIWSSNRFFPNNHVYHLCLEEFGILKTENYYMDLFSEIDEKLLVPTD